MLYLTRIHGISSVSIKNIKEEPNICLFQKICVILHPNMKKMLNIVLTSVLAITLIVMASGVTFHHCSCSGKTTMLLGNLKENTENSMASSKKCMPTSKKCMTVSSMSLSPTTMAQPLAFDFHVLLPLVTIINDWHLFQLIPQQVESTRSFLPTDFFSPPPRQYLHILHVLTI